MPTVNWGQILVWLGACCLLLTKVVFLCTTNWLDIHAYGKIYAKKCAFGTEISSF